MQTLDFWTVNESPCKRALQGNPWAVLQAG